MIPAIPDDVVTCVVWSAGCFVAGVAYSAYRAIGWVERIRIWAVTVPIEESEVIL